MADKKQATHGRQFQLILNMKSLFQLDSLDSLDAVVINGFYKSSYQTIPSE